MHADLVSVEFDDPAGLCDQLVSCVGHVDEIDWALGEVGENVIAKLP